eukprot:TRINITY_DN4892_c0_g1_i1.p1 TRINITY_DN4892_c0_g1~~TRINITY_DN4892_c0_g1_i1.p1  ORF type:complete len:694 (+),score=180.17 TRINITY_DN4892_c0_g1_i1:163-2082(+)
MDIHNENKSINMERNSFRSSESKPIGIFGLIEEKDSYPPIMQPNPQIERKESSIKKILRRNKSMLIESSFQEQISPNNGRKGSRFQKKRLELNKEKQEKIHLTMRLREIVQNKHCRNVFTEEYQTEERERINWLLQLWQEIDYLLDLKNGKKSIANSGNDSENSIFGEMNSLVSISSLSFEIYESYFKDTKHSLKDDKISILFKSHVEKYKHEGQKIRFWKNYSTLMQINQVFKDIFKKIQISIIEELKLKINSIWICYIQEYNNGSISMEGTKFPRELTGVYYAEISQEGESTVDLRAATVERIVQWLIWKGDKTNFVNFIVMQGLFVVPEELFKILIKIYRNPSLIEYSDNCSPILVKQTIIQFFKLWVDIFQTEIEDCRKLLNKMIKFAEKIEDPSFMFNLSKLKTLTHITVNKSIKQKAIDNITEVPVESLANHLLYLEVVNFDRITSGDFMKHEDSKGINQWCLKSANIDSFFERLFAQNDKKPAKVNLICYLINLAKKVFTLRNYNTLMQINGVFAKYVSEEDFSMIPPKVLDKWIEMEEFLGARFNFKNYRNQVRDNLEGQKACVPFLALHLKDLTYVCCSFSSVESNHLIPYEAILSKGKIVQLLLRLKHCWQNTTFNVSQIVLDYILKKD